MKYILGICNLIGVMLLGYVMTLWFRHSIAAEADYQATVNKYKTEDAAQVAYLTTLYHYGDWTTVLGDTLAVQRGMTPSESARAFSVKKVGTALSFEETCVSYIIAFNNGITAVIEPYTVYDDGENVLTVMLDLKQGTLITRKADGSAETLDIDTEEELVSVFTRLNHGNIEAPHENLYDALVHARTKAINNIIRKAMGYSGYKTQDTIYIAAHDNNIPGIRTIKNQTLLVLQGTNTLTSSSTSLAGYTKIEKRQVCVVVKNINGQNVRFYCYSDELPPGVDAMSIVNLYESKEEAARSPALPYFMYR